MNKTKQKKLMIVKYVVATVFILVLIAGISTTVGNAGQRKINELLNLGNKYLEDMDYEEAILAFDQAIAIDPKCEEAYLGKAQAQYALGQYEDAIATLEEGIVKVDDSSRLEIFLQQILKEMTGEGNWETDTGSVEAEMSMKKALELNYVEIVRFADTQEPEIQLEILGDEGNEEKYTWESSVPKCATVSSTGLVACKPVEGTAMIYAVDEYGNKSKECIVRIYSSDSGAVENESETVRFKSNMGEEEAPDYAVVVAEKEGVETATVDIFGENIYYSGDVTIPETLQFNGKEIPITGISGRAFRWSDQMDSIYIPATIEDMGVREHETSNPFYYCSNLREIRVDETSKFLKAEGGVLFSKDGKTLYSYPAGKEDSSYTLPKEVEKVCSGAFLGCKNLKEILVEEGNEYYESMDGAIVDKKREIMIAYPIGNGLTSYTVPDGVRYLDPDVFYSSMLEEIDCSTVEWIYDDAFRQCDRLERIRGGKNTTSIYWGLNKTVEFLGLSTMENLERLTISKKGLSSEMKNQIRELEEQRPEVSIEIQE